jgi:hypothetical protein
MVSAALLQVGAGPTPAPLGVAPAPLQLAAGTHPSFATVLCSARWSCCAEWQGQWFPPLSSRLSHHLALSRSSPPCRCCPSSAWRVDSHHRRSSSWRVGLRSSSSAWRRHSPPVVPSRGRCRSSFAWRSWRVTLLLPRSLSVLLLGVLLRRHACRRSRYRHACRRCCVRCCWCCSERR